MAVVPLWVKYLASELQGQDIVAGLEIHDNRIRLRYTTNFLEIFYFKPRIYKHHPAQVFFITEKDAQLGKPIPIYRPYEIDPLDQDQQYDLDYHIKVERSDFDAGTVIDKRLVIHRIIQKLIETESRPHCYPDKVLEADYQDIKSMKLGRFITKDAFNFFPRMKRDSSWRRLVEHFFEFGRSYDRVSYWVALNTIAKKRFTRFTTAEIVKRAGWFKASRLYNPVPYAAILKRFESDGGVIDLHPNMGHKAIACAILGVPYFAPPCPEIDNALNRGILSLTKLHYEPLEDQKASVLLSDKNFTFFSIDDAEQYLDKAHTMIAFVPASERFDICAEHNPSSVVKVFTTPSSGKIYRDHNYLAVW